jgi:transcriptional regulator with PAS, ATPase and Fis domain
MVGSRLAIVTLDESFAHAIQAHLREIGQSAVCYTPETFRARLRIDTDGVAILGATNGDDAVKLVRLVHEVRVKQWPPAFMAIEANGASTREQMAVLDPYIIKRLRWPEESSALDALVKHHIGRGRNFTDTDQESLVEVIGHHLLSQTPSLQMLVEPIALAASYDVPVLLSGETGTGKTFLARLIHECSARKNHRFLVVSCGALAANLIESEFFGHTKGAFTGADRAKEGKFAAAGQGTLLLDEIDTLSMEQQANLLRVLETGEYEPVGSNETKVCDARIIAASNWDLEEAVEQGKFRRDLYYRLHVMAFHLPPLRERKQDIAPLARGMAAHFNDKFRKGLFDISADAVQALESFPWPGNIRQLENVIQQAVLVSTRPQLVRANLPPSVQKNANPPATNGYALGSSLVHNREEVERVSIQRALEKAGNNRTEAAEALGISRVTLYKKMKKYGLMNPKFQTA